METLQEYAPTRLAGFSGGLIARVEEGSPAHRAGLRSGMTLTAVDGEKLSDLLEWYWLSDGFEVEVDGFYPAASFPELDGASDDEDEMLQNDCGIVEFSAIVSREPGEMWGIEFAECVFDGVRTCRNACIFCFMSMLPSGMRPALYLRDDDYRLSFLQGNFVTLTNMLEEDIERIIAMQLSPLHVSVHAVDPDVRLRIMGRNEGVGRSALARLLDAGIEIHAQIVLMPGENDGVALSHTLSWLEEHPGVLSVGIVPLGFTRFQERFSTSFLLEEDARSVIEQVRPYQERARAEYGKTRFHLSDEFYIYAHLEFPPTELYDGFPQYEDGIGMLRSFSDEWKALSNRIDAVSKMCTEKVHPSVVFVTGAAFGPFLDEHLTASGLSDAVRVLVVKNAFFGGNVNVAGLLTASDVLSALADIGRISADKAQECGTGVVLLPKVMFNADGFSLDDMTIGDMCRVSGKDIRMVSCSPSGLVDTLESIFNESGM